MILTRLHVVCLLGMAACTDTSSNVGDSGSGTDSNVIDSNVVDASDAGADTGCPPCAVGKSVVGNCCVK